MSMCISVKKIQRTKFDVSQKPLIQKMHTEPEILNSGFGGVILHSDLPRYIYVIRLLETFQNFWGFTDVLVVLKNESCIMRANYDVPR